MHAFDIVSAKFSAIINNPEFVYLFINNRFYMVLLVVFLMRLKYATYSSMWLSALINIPGTFLHELMHLTIGALFNARPCNFSIFPKRNEYGEYVMGSVGFRNITYYNAIPAALAPILLLPIAFYLDRYIRPTISPSVLNYILYILLQTILIENAIPSRVDFQVAGKFISGIVIYVSIAVLALVFL